MTPPTKTDRRLPPEALRWTCNPADLGFTTTADLPRQAAIVGQARGVHAIQFGLAINQHGYNVFVSGPPGTGRSSYARLEVERIAKAQPAPQDWCYVRNFAVADQPIAISLGTGTGRVFREGVADLVTEVREGLRRVFAGEAFEQQRATVAKRYEQQLADIWQQLENQAKIRGLLLQRTPTGIATVPVDLQGRPVAPEVFQTLPEVERARIAARTKELEDVLAEAQRKARRKSWRSSRRPSRTCSTTSPSCAAPGTRRAPNRRARSSRSSAGIRSPGTRSTCWWTTGTPVGRR